LESPWRQQERQGLFVAPPLPGSPAIDTGDNTDTPMWDQRGPGYPRIVNGIIDIGAFEVQAPAASRPAGQPPPDPLPVPSPSLPAPNAPVPAPSASGTLPTGLVGSADATNRFDPSPEVPSTAPLVAVDQRLPLLRGNALKAMAAWWGALADARGGSINLDGLIF
jgi:hypothetical protein